jgi:glutathione-regulated potassium-efflux system ancillary protein KefG
MKNILILFAHPALQRSLVNRELIKIFNNKENITFHDLYEKYPQMEIDVEYEQELLLKNDVIVFMFPMFWYSTPAILKEWQDIVLEHDWAYGSKGNKLKDKIFHCILSTGGKAEAYEKEGYNRFTIREFLRPIEQMARLCKMVYIPPYAVSGTHSMTSKILDEHKSELDHFFSKLGDGQIEISSIQEYDLLNQYLNITKG